MEPEFKKQLLAFFKECYESELEKREKATARLTLNLAVITLVFNVALTYLNHLPRFRVEWLVLAFYVFLSVGIFSGLLAIYFYVRSLVLGAYKYAYLPSPQEISEYLEGAETYNAAILKSCDKIDLRADFEDNLLKQYSDFATKNAKNNHRRSDFLYKTSLCTVIAIIFFIICAPLFYIDKYRSPIQPQKIEIVNPITIKNEQQRISTADEVTNGGSQTGWAATNLATTNRPSPSTSSNSSDHP